MKELKTKVVGVSFENRQEIVQQVQPGFILFWKHDADNQYDPNAIAVYVDPDMQKQVGHLKRELAKEFVQWIAEGKKPRIIADQVTGGKAKQSFGLNVRVIVDD